MAVDRVGLPANGTRPLDVLALHGAGFVEAFTERSANARGARGPLGAVECNGRRRRLLGTSRKRPCDPCACRAAEQRDEVPPSDHSITSSAIARSAGGTERSSIL